MPSLRASRAACRGAAPPKAIYEAPETIFVADFLGVSNLVPAEASGRHENAALHERSALGPGMSLDGPALIVEDGTTTVVPQGFSARINALGQIVLEDVT